MKSGSQRSFLKTILIFQIIPLVLANGATHIVPIGESKWDQLKEFSEGLAGVCRNGQWGFIDTNSQLVISLQNRWKYEGPFQNGLAQVDFGDANFDFIDKTGRSIVRSGQSSSNELAWPRMLMTSSTRELRFSYGLIPVGNKAGKNGFMDRRGRLVAPPRWDQVSDFHEGLAGVKIYDSSNQTSRAGFVDTNGQIAIPLKWNSTSSFSEGLALVETNYHYGFINKSGDEVIPLQWDGCESFRDGYALVLKKHKPDTGSPTEYKYGIIDRTGKVVVEPEFTGVMLSRPVVVFKQGKEGIIDNTGHVAEGLWWDSVKPPRTNPTINDRNSAEYRSKPAVGYTVKVEKDKKWGLVDINGKIVVEPVWEDVGFSEGDVTPVKRDGKWGLLDRSGKLVVQPLWEDLNSPATSDKTVIARKNGKWGLFAKTGAAVAKPQWDAVTSFSEGLAMVRVDAKWGLIDETGKVITTVKWDWAEPPKNGLFRVREGQEWYYMKIERN